MLFVQLEQKGFGLSAVRINKDGENGDLKKYESIDDLIKKEGKQFPYVIHINGFGVLTRVVENSPNFKENLLVAGNQNEFYFNSVACLGTVGVSFVRKSLLEAIFTPLRDSKIHLFGVHIGPIPVVASMTDNARWRGEYLIEKKAGSIIQLDRNDAEHEMRVREKMLAGADCFEMFFDTIEGYFQGLGDEELSRTKSNYKEHKRFVFLGLSLLIFFLSALTINYFYINHLNQLAAETEAEIASYGNNLSMIDRLNQEKQRKSILIENSGIKTNRFVSYYIDKIGATVKPGISLTKLETFPLIDGLKPKKKVEVSNDFIQIEGICPNSEILDNWVETLQKEEWIESVELVNYIRQTENQANFELSIKIIQ
jgi:hypothetical protein